MLTQAEALMRMFLPATSNPDWSDRTAVVQVVKTTERTFSFADIERLIAGAMQELKSLGVGAGDKVVLCSENSPELSSTILACWALNAMAVPLDFRTSAQEISNIIKELKPKVFAVSKNMFFDFKNEEKILASEHVVVLELTSLAKYAKLEPQCPFDLSTIDLKKPAFLILTSGTTGKPKGAIHNLESLLPNLIEIGEMAGIDETMTGVFPLPISHIFGMEVFLVSQLFGLKVVLTELAPTGFVLAVRKHKPHLIASLPMLYGAMLSAPDGAVDLGHTVLLLCGGAPLAPALAEKFEKKFGKRLNNGYGSTESKIVAFNKNGPIESVGQIVPSATIEIVNEKDEVVPDGQSGEVRIAGPMLMNGYLAMDEETKKALHDGHYHTGDIGHFEDGHLFVSGRLKEIIIVGGSKVFSGELENMLRQDKIVREVAVIGRSHPELGQIAKAIIVLNEDELSKKLEGSDDEKKEGRQQLVARFEEHCKDLRREMRPAEWEFRGPHDMLPKTLAGKIDKKQLEKTPA